VGADLRAAMPRSVKGFFASNSKLPVLLSC
jgi:hypothetical protein